MHIVFSVERERGMGLPCREPNRTQRKTLPWGTSLLCTEYQPNQKGDSRSWQNKSDVQVFSFKVFWGHFFFFPFSSEVTKQNNVISVWDQILVHFYLPFPTDHRMDHVPFILRVTSYSTASLKERKQKLCFSATDLAI